MKNLETEFKWECSAPSDFVKAVRVMRTLGKLSAPANLSICDTYLDHADEQFSKQKIAFRVRHVSHRWEATFKTRTEVKNGKAVRREETLPLSGVKNLPQALLFLTRKKTWKNLDVRDLQKQFVLKNKRRILNVRYKKCQAELALDKFSILVCGHEVKMREIELELKRGSQKDFEALALLFTARSGLTFVKNSKVKTAYALRRMWSENA